MFTKVLIANRGEIACRIARASGHHCTLTSPVPRARCRPRHVRFADEACGVRPAASRDSNLRGERTIEAVPMPGKTIALAAEVSAEVEKGAALVVMEAMKMEHTLAAPARGRVTAFLCSVGEQVEDGAELVEFEADS